MPQPDALTELENRVNAMELRGHLAYCTNISNAAGCPHSRLGRIVAAGFPHHVTQRGNHRQTIFFEPADFALHRDLLAERCSKASVEVWADIFVKRVH
jgi:hypothetical protein